MTIYVYGDSATKQISAITSSQLVGDSRVEVQLADTHNLRYDPDPYSNYRLNSTDDDVEFISKPKIYALAKGEAANKHFHNIDYKIELTQSLYAKRTMIQGEVTQVDWYSDIALTDKVIRVNVSYNRDSIGFALNRTTTRTWINEDETDHPDVKVTQKDYTINLNEQLEEGQRRRGNLVNKLSLEVLGRMQVVLYGVHTPEEIVQMGRDFLLQHSVAWAEFVKVSHQQILADIALPDSINDEWLDAWMIDNVITIRDYMIQEMTLY